VHTTHGKLTALVSV